jgi:hypothetical protein
MPAFLLHGERSSNQQQRPDVAERSPDDCRGSYMIEWSHQIVTTLYATVDHPILRVTKSYPLLSKFLAVFMTRTLPERLSTSRKDTGGSNLQGECRRRFCRWPPHEGRQEADRSDLETGWQSTRNETLRIIFRVGHVLP